jgi:hypothetical protein
MVKRKKTNKIIFHHILAKSATIEDITRWHIEKGYETCGYHKYIRKDGSVYDGRSLVYKGAHAFGRNDAIGVALEGDFRTEEPTKKQIEACGNLFHSLCRMYGKSLKIEFHRPYIFNIFEPSEYGRFVACPGPKMDRADFVEILSRYNPYVV